MWYLLILYLITHMFHTFFCCCCSIPLSLCIMLCNFLNLSFSSLIFSLILTGCCLTWLLTVLFQLYVLFEEVFFFFSKSVTYFWWFYLLIFLLFLMCWFFILYLIIPKSLVFIDLAFVFCFSLFWFVLNFFGDLIVLGSFFTYGNSQRLGSKVLNFRECLREYLPDA